MKKSIIIAILGCITFLSCTKEEQKVDTMAKEKLYIKVESVNMNGEVIESTTTKYIIVGN
jgi:hypothetical protein